MRIAVIGGGHMASGLVGALRARGTDGASIVVSEPLVARRTELERLHGVHTTSDNAAAAAAAPTVVLAVKPQDMPAVATGIAPALAGRRVLVLSVAAGIRLLDLGRWLGAGPALVRAMPNRPALIARGITALCAGAGVSPQERALAEEIFAATGEAIWIESEPLLDVVTAVSGSGPAYFFMLMEALEDAGRELGLPAGIARQLAVATAAGAGAMAAEGAAPPATLREQVTSPGGTTAAALAVLEAADLRGIFSAAVAAAARRAGELAAQGAGH